MKDIFSTIKRFPFSTWIAIVDALILILGGILFFYGYKEYTGHIFKFATFILALPLWYAILRDIFKMKFGVDLIAGVAILGAWILGQHLAGLIIILMLSGGEALEAYAMDRAKFELTKLLQKSPTHATKKVGEKYIEISVDEIIPGDEILIKSGEIMPVDGVVISGSSLVDESNLTGESLPIEKTAGSLISSGTENTTGSLLIKAEKIAKESRYAKIILLVKEAEESKAPIVRLADKYAIVFTLITAVVATFTWFLFHDSLRVLAVLVVATPCPLILATPIAMISGMSRSAKSGIIVKNGGALESLSRVRTILFDKTGTITVGTPEIEEINSLDGEDKNLLSIAASLDHGSSHILARSIVNKALLENALLYKVSNFKEIFGQGVEGTIESMKYLLGKLAFIKSQNIYIPKKIEDSHNKYHDEGKMIVYISRGIEVIGSIVFSDKARKDAEGIFEKLRTDYGISTAMLTGDHENVALRIANQVGIKDVYAECKPEDKVAIVGKASKINGLVAMVGDGINDAPALARADVGIAMAFHGDTSSSYAADIAIMHNSIKRVADVYYIAKKTVNIAKQGIFLGIGLSIIAMVFAGLGYISPVSGALLQEVIDVMVILGALRVLRIKT